MSEPVVARVGCTGAALADVLVADQGSASAAQRCAEVLHRYPGVMVVLVVSPNGAVTAGFRDGATLLSMVEDLCRWTAERGEPGAYGGGVPRTECGEGVER